MFLLEDDTGTCVIDPDDAEVTPSISETWYGTRATRSLDTFNVYPRIRVLSKILARNSRIFSYVLATAFIVLIVGIFFKLDAYI